MTRTELERVLNWADGKLAAGAEPPWAWYQYMKLRETLQAILAGIQAASPRNGEFTAIGTTFGGRSSTSGFQCSTR